MERTVFLTPEGEREPRVMKVWSAAKALLEAWPEQWDEVGMQPAFLYDEDTKTSTYVGIEYVFFKAGKVVEIVTARPRSLLDNATLLDTYVQKVAYAFTKAGVPMPDPPAVQEAA